MAEPRRTAVLVAGAGPAGCSAAIQCRRLGMELTLAEASGTAGGLLTEARRVENLPLLEVPVAGAELARRLAAHLRSFGIEPEPWQVTAVSPRPGGGFLSETSGGPVESAVVILATGTRPVVYDLAGEHPPLLRSFLELPPDLRGLRIAVIGGGEAAFDYALHARDLGATVDLLVRGASPRTTGRLTEEAAARGGLRILYDTVPVAARSEGSTTVLELACRTGRRSLRADAVLAAVGRERVLPDVSGEFLFPGGGRVDTSIPGLFLAGDASLGALGQAGSAVGQGLTAAAEAARHLRGGGKRSC